MLLILILSPVSSFGAEELAEEQGVKPYYGGKTPGSALEVEFGIPDPDGFVLGDQYRDNWYYTTTSKRGDIIFEMQDIWFNNLDLYVYDYLADKLLCKSTNSGTKSEKCTLPKSTTTEWKFYIKVVPVNANALGAKATLYFHADEWVCKLYSAFWEEKNSNPEVTEGDGIYAYVTGNSYCDGKSASFNVWEDDKVSSDTSANRNPSSATFSNGVAKSKWTAEWLDDWPDGDPEYRFKASVSGVGEIESGNDVHVKKKCTDNDEDGYGKPASNTCRESKEDCNDNDREVNPGASEKCDGKDNDCDNKVDEGVKNACGGCGNVPSEVCDGGDNNCDGVVDEGVKNVCGGCGSVPAEICDGNDNNCNGFIDEGFDKQNDVNNCGTCGNKCLSGYKCSQGACVLKCGDGVCELNEFCSRDCLKIKEIIPPSGINEGQSIEVKVNVENLGNIEMSDNIELGLVPPLWEERGLAKPTAL